jgi:hypothetical protein
MDEQLAGGVQFPDPLTVSVTTVCAIDGRPAGKGYTLRSDRGG